MCLAFTLGCEGSDLEVLGQEHAAVVPLRRGHQCRGVFVNRGFPAPAKPRVPRRSESRFLPDSMHAVPTARVGLGFHIALLPCCFAALLAAMCPVQCSTMRPKHAWPDYATGAFCRMALHCAEVVVHYPYITLYSFICMCRCIYMYVYLYNPSIL